MDMRIRIPELLNERGLSWYALARESQGRISPSAAFRLTEAKGRIKRFDAKLLDALCDVLNVDPNGLLQRDPELKQEPATRRRKK
jgi:DNA-binding Xre family transcriptional regulator